jgi:predicted nucleic acid-binding protein
LRGRAEHDLFLSVITLGEIERGIRQQETRDPAFANDLRNWLDRTVLLFSDRLLAFEAEDARIWGRLSAKIGHNGADLMIAASALRHGAIVVTGNVSDFAPTGAATENPF